MKPNKQLQRFLTLNSWVVKFLFERYFLLRLYSLTIRIENKNLDFLPAEAATEVASAADTEAILVEDLVVDMEVVAMEDHMVLTSKAVKSTLEMYSL